MKKWMYGNFLILLLLTGCHDNNINEIEVLLFYDEFLKQVHELFAYHTYEEEMYFNEKYHTEDSIRSLLDPYMTEEGVNRMLNDLYIQEEDRFFYREDFQSYFQEYDNGESSYYDITRQTVFNPGLRMMIDELIIQEVEGLIEIKAEELPIHFYSEESSYGQSQFGRLGYPAVDHLSLRVTMIKDHDQFRIDHVEVQYN